MTDQRSAAIPLDRVKLRARLEIEAAREQTYPVCLTSRQCLALLDEYEALKVVQESAANHITNALDSSDDVALEGRRRLIEALTDYEVVMQRNA